MKTFTHAALRFSRFSVSLWQWSLCYGFLLAVATIVFGQQPAGNLPIAQGNQPNQGNQGNVFDGIAVGNGLVPGGEGGSAQADFDSLIDLIQSTVEPDTWTENGTGEGEISPFPTGVFADARSALQFADDLEALGSHLQTVRVVGDVRRSSPLRFVSLPRLEAAILRKQISHQALPPEMLTLAGLRRIECIVVDPKRHDLLIAGPAGDWQVDDSSGQIVSVETGQPVVRLDDFLTLWRRRQTHPVASFGCSINPREEALVRTQDYIRSSNRNPIEPNQRGEWLKGLRSSLGAQEVEFFGIDPATHVSRVLLAADYHMKLIGMGIADGVEGVESYLSTVQLLPDGSAPPMAVLRWWFTMLYEPVEVGPERNVFRLKGQGVRVLSENELLAARGRRVHTGHSDELNQRFATSFTEHFESLSAAYPLYTELRNVFDLSVVLAIIEREGLLERIGWQGQLYCSAQALRLPRVAVPRELETVVNHRVINRRYIIAGISGGVWADPGKTVRISTEGEKRAPVNLLSQPPEDESGEELWWWDQPIQ